MNIQTHCLRRKSDSVAIDHKRERERERERKKREDILVAKRTLLLLEEAIIS